MSDPNGLTGIVLTVGGDLGIGFEKANEKWKFKNPFGADLSAGVGGEFEWTYHKDGKQGYVLKEASGPSTCWEGSLDAFAGATASHCWEPTPGVPYELAQPEFIRAGNHSVYAGVSVSVGGGIAFTHSVTYSVLVTCAEWLGLVHIKCPPISTQPPTIQGTASQGEPLSVSRGSWEEIDDKTEYLYQWNRCNSAATSCDKIGSPTTQSSYTIGATDVGHTLTVTEIAKNAGGETEATSQPTAVVSAGGPAAMAQAPVSGRTSNKPHAVRPTAQSTIPATKTATQRATSNQATPSPANGATTNTTPANAGEPTSTATTPKRFARPDCGSTTESAPICRAPTTPKGPAAGPRGAHRGEAVSCRPSNRTTVKSFHTSG